MKIQSWSIIIEAENLWSLITSWRKIFTISDVINECFNDKKCTYCLIGQQLLK